MKYLAVSLILATSKHVIFNFPNFSIMMALAGNSGHWKSTHQKVLNAGKQCLQKRLTVATKITHTCITLQVVFGFTLFCWSFKHQIAQNKTPYQLEILNIKGVNNIKGACWTLKGIMNGGWLGPNLKQEIQVFRTNYTESQD